MQQGHTECKSYLEVVLHVTVCVFGNMQEDEQILAEIMGQGSDP